MLFFISGKKSFSFFSRVDWNLMTSLTSLNLFLSILVFFFFIILFVYGFASFMRIFRLLFCYLCSFRRFPRVIEAFQRYEFIKLRCILLFLWLHIFGRLSSNKLLMVAAMQLVVEHVDFSLSLSLSLSLSVCLFLFFFFPCIIFTSFCFIQDAFFSARREYSQYHYIWLYGMRQRAQQPPS